MAALVTAPLERQFGQIPALAHDDLVELLRHQPDHAAIRPRPRHRRRRAGRAGRDQRRGLDPAAQPPLSADLCQGEPGRRADHDAGADLADRRVARSKRPRRHAAGAAAGEVAGVGRVSVQGGIRPAVRIQADLARLAGLRHRPGGRAHRRSSAPMWRGRRARSTARISPTPSRPTTSSRPPTPTARWSSPIATARRCCCGDVADVIDGLENYQRRAPGTRASRRW